MTTAPVLASVRNVADLVRRSAQERPEHAALVASGATTTWAQLDAAVDQTASGLLRHGLVPGDRVALVLGNSPAFVASYFGVLRAGLVVVPLNPTYTEVELEDRIADVGAALVVADPVTAQRVGSVAGEVVVVGGAVVREPSAWRQSSRRARAGG